MEGKIWDYQSFKIKKMWNTKKEIAHHEKMIGVLEMIASLNNRILSNLKDEKLANNNDFFGMKKYHQERLKTNEKMKERLINYYKNQTK